MGYILASAALMKLVLATDVDNADGEDLTYYYAGYADDHVSNGIRFFYCHGLAIALLFMAVISWTHEHRHPPSLRWGKSHRLANRLAICLIMFLLPLAKELQSLHLIAITTGLTFWVLFVETWGKSSTEDSFFGMRKGRSLKYRAHIRRKDLKKVLQKERDEGVERVSAEAVRLSQNEKTAVEV